MHRPGIAFACLFAFAGWVNAASPDPADLAVPAELQVKTRNLVQQLGSEDFAEREDAQQQLADLGRLAKPALLYGVNHSPNAEIRFRCAELLPAASTLDIRARLDTFLADTKGEYEHDLPAWKHFRALACREWSFLGTRIWSDRAAEQAAREVFAELVASPINRRILLASERSRVELADLVIGRRQDLYNRRYPRDGDTPSRDPTLEDVTALLFGESIVGSVYFPRRTSISFLMSSSGFTTAARGTDDKGRVYRGIAIAWLRSRNDPREMYQAMSTAANLDLPDHVCDLASRLLAMPGVTTLNRARAATYLMDYGNRTHVRLLEKALTNTAVVESVRINILTEVEPELVTHDIQVRDLALVVSLTLTNQKPADYGFADRYSGGNLIENPSASSKRYYFTSDDARQKALAKWTAWRKENANK